MTDIPVQEAGWEYNDVCPCDTQFIEYLTESNIGKLSSAVIFHMGPGMHHKVGLWAVEQKKVFVRSMTLAPKEILEYIRLATADPWLNSRYLVDFGDIHLLDKMLLPKFDFISLFHLGEISAQAFEEDYPGHNIETVLTIMSQRLSIGGEMLFYERSAAWEKIRMIIDFNLYDKYSYKKSNFKDLAIFRKKVL